MDQSCKFSSSKMPLKAFLLALIACVLFIIMFITFLSVDLSLLSDNDKPAIAISPSEDDSSPSPNHLQKGVLHAVSIEHTGDLRKDSNKGRTSLTMGDERVIEAEEADELSTYSDEEEEHFDITKLNEHLKVCIREKDEEVDMDQYIFVFRQLYKFFVMLGTVFSFVGSDVKSKIEILEDYRTGENRTHYETVEKMISFEKSSDFINTNKESSGSRTLLRLHRALNFVSKFLGRVEDIKDSDGTASICKQAYAETLQKFHPWLIQKGAMLAMYALPNKKELIKKVCDGRVESTEVMGLLNEVIASTERVYDQCQSLYEQHELLELP